MRRAWGEWGGILAYLLVDILINKRPLLVKGCPVIPAISRVVPMTQLTMGYV